MEIINRRNFPELDNILWDVHNDTIDAKNAFEIYERRWQYVDAERLTEEERELIRVLTQKFGNGLFLSGEWPIAFAEHQVV